jgi:putative ABC transport system permease protein
MRSLEAILQDLHFALRMLRSSLGSTAIAILILALGIGASTAIFSVVHAVVLSPLPYRNPERLITLAERNLSAPGLDRMSFGSAHDFLRRSNSIESIAFYRDISGHLLENGLPEILRGLGVSPEFFDTLGVKPHLGRTFLAEDRLPGRNDVVILSYSLWKGRFGGDPAIVGRELQINRRPFRVIGVLNPDFHSPRMSNLGEAPQIFRPLDLETLESQDRHSGIRALVRLKLGVSTEQARVELNAIYQDLIRQYPNDYPRAAAMDIEPLKEHLTKKVRVALWILLGAVGFVLSISCANVANLLLTRAMSRDAEISLRMALGCGRGRLIRQLLTESLLLSLLGGLVGVSWRGGP